MYKILVSLFILMMACIPFLNAQEIFLVRHADRLGDGDALSEAGVNRSLALAHTLENVGLDAIFSTDYTRTLETVKPLAQHLQIDIEIYDPRDLNGLISTIQSKYAQGKVLVVGHSNTIPQTINAIGVQPALSDLEHNAYDDLFLVMVRDATAPSLIKMQYGVDDHH